MRIRRLSGLAAAAALLLSAGAFVDSPGPCGGTTASWWPSGRAHAKDFAKLRSLDDRKEAENWTPGRRQERIELFKSDQRVGVDAYVTSRDHKGYFYNSLSCTDCSDEGVMCAMPTSA